MSITGWRAREFSSLLADLGEGLDDLGVPEGQPFLISPAGVYDVALNRYFSVWLASSPWNTQAAHVRDLRTYFDFLWFARGRRDWRDAPMDDRAAFEWWGRSPTTAMSAGSPTSAPTWPPAPRTTR